jgi:hypothetical protein
VSSIAQEWRAFRQDAPGHRFCNHYHRRHNHSRAGRAVRIGLGVALLAGEIVLLFIPGPGLLVAVFGLGLVAGESGKLANLLDRAELPVRRRARSAKRWWDARSTVAKVGVVAAAVALAAPIAVYFTWRLFG